MSCATADFRSHTNITLTTAETAFHSVKSGFTTVTNTLICKIHSVSVQILLSGTVYSESVEVLNGWMHKSSVISLPEVYANNRIEENMATRRASQMQCIPHALPSKPISLDLAYVKLCTLIQHTSQTCNTSVTSVACECNHFNKSMCD